MATVKLSVMIVSLYQRASLLNRLLSVLQPQLTDEVELLICVTGKEESTGSKRQRLKECSVGDYLCYIDDDDLVSNDYIKLLLTAIAAGRGVDCIGFSGTLECPNEKVYQVHYSISNRDKSSEREGDTYKCFVGHLTPVRRDLINDVRFEDLDVGEDEKFCKALKERCHTEYFVDSVLYRYLTSYNV